MNEKTKKTFFFHKLAEKRKEKKITLDNIVDGIKIKKSYITAIENGNFHLLPKIYVRLFIKSYSKFIGENEKLALKNYQNYILGNNHETSKTPDFIKKKTKLNDVISNDRQEIEKRNIRTNNKAAAIFIIVLLISMIFVIRLFNQNTTNINISEWNNNKLNWKIDFINSGLFDSEIININLEPQNILIYSTSNFPDKIIITDNEGKNISNRILEKNDFDKSHFENDIKFGILIGSGQLKINNQSINFKYPGHKVKGLIKKNQLVLNYLK